MKKSCQHCGKPFPASHSSRKYCCQSCRQYAYLVRNGMSLSVKPENVLGKAEIPVVPAPAPQRVKDSTSIYSGYYMSCTSVHYFQSVNDRKKNPEEEKISASPEPLSPKQEKTSAENIQPPEPLASVNDLPLLAPVNDNNTGENFEYIIPLCIQRLEQLERSRPYGLLFHYPKQWNELDQYYVRTVNTKLRCVMDNLLCLSYPNTIDAANLVVLERALEELARSFEYHRLPANYPYREDIATLKDKLHALTGNLKPGDKTRLMLGAERKNQLIIMLYEIGDTVPKKKFSELFSELLCDDS